VTGAAQVALCRICGEPMAPGEQMFYYHGSLGPCPKPPLPRPPVGGFLHMSADRWVELSKLASLEMQDALAEVAAQRAEVRRLHALLVAEADRFDSCSMAHHGDRIRAAL